MRLSKRERAIMNEAFMTGRVYASMGEKESPAEICEKLEENCIKAIKRIKSNMMSYIDKVKLKSQR